jgi:hypothetical protein
MVVNSDLLKILRLKISRFVILCFTVLTFSACQSVFEGIERPKDDSKMDANTEKFLTEHSDGKWEWASPEMRCHFIYSATCEEIEKAKGIKFNSHFTRCGYDHDLEYSKIDNGRNLLEIRNITFVKSKDVTQLSDSEIQNGLVFSGSVYFISQTNTLYDTALKTRFTSPNTGLPSQTDKYAVWYEERNVKNQAGQIVKEGQWSCDICKLSKKYSQVDCIKELPTDLPTYRVEKQ